MRDIKVWGPLNNGNYWQLKWVTPEGVIRTRSLGSKAKLSKSRAKSLCINFAAKLQADPLANPTDDFTIQNLIDARAEAYRNAAPTTIKSEAAAMESIRRFFGSNAKIMAISRHRADEWEKSVSQRPGRNAETVTETTVRKYNGIVKRIFKWAIDRGYLAQNPFRSLKSAARDRVHAW